MSLAKTVLAIDPGSKKCGLALVRREANNSITMLWHHIEPTPSLPDAIRRAMDVEAFSMVVVGNGTTSRPLLAVLREEFPSLGILVVDEQDTSMQARERYWEHHPRRGWRRILPATLQVPPEPIDDFAALILAERVLI